MVVYMYVRVYILPLSMILIFDFGIVPTIGIFFSSFYCNIALFYDLMVYYRILA